MFNICFWITTTYIFIFCKITTYYNVGFLRGTFKFSFSSSSNFLFQILVPPFPVPKRRQNRNRLSEKILTYSTFSSDIRWTPQKLFCLQFLSTQEFVPLSFGKAMNLRISLPKDCVYKPVIIHVLCSTLPVGSPVCTMKPFIFLWNLQPL